MNFSGDSDSDDDIEMSVISKGRHDIVIKEEGKVSGGFFKVTKKQYPMYPFKEDKIKYDEYGEIIRPEDYKLSDVVTDSEDNKENVVVKKEEEEIGQFLQLSNIIHVLCKYLSFSSVTLYFVKITLIQILYPKSKQTHFSLFPFPSPIPRIVVHKLDQININWFTKPELCYFCIK